MSVKKLIPENKNKKKVKLAILLLCHKNIEQINIMLQTLQHPDIEFFIHLDVKSKINANQLLKRTDVHILKDSLRVDVRWGEFSQVRATLNLMRTAYAKKRFNYYWLCSGQDFPIKSADYIVDFFKRNFGANYLRFRKLMQYDGKDERKLNKRNTIYYPHWLYTKNNIFKQTLRRLYIIFTGGYNYTYPLFKRKSRFFDIKAYFGAQWICVTNKFVTWMLQYLKNNTWYENFFMNAMVPDESFFHTLFMISPYRKTLHDYLHYIEWKDGNYSPNILTMANLDRLKNSNYLMARKFDINIDRQIIETLADHK